MVSSRRYLVTGIEGDTSFVIEYSLKTLLQDDGLEIGYALQDELDNILDLKVGESIHIFVNRDNPEDKGVIKRVQ